MKESVEKQTNLCKFFLDNTKLDFMGVKCGHGDARYCPHINNPSISCLIKDDILQMKCCSFCGYHERFMINIKSKNSNTYVLICSNCKKKIRKEEIITYEELIQRKDIKRLRKSWFCGNNKTIY